MAVKVAVKMACMHGWMLLIILGVSMPDVRAMPWGLEGDRAYLETVEAYVLGGDEDKKVSLARLRSHLQKLSAQGLSLEQGSKRWIKSCWLLVNIAVAQDEVDGCTGAETVLTSLKHLRPWLAPVEEDLLALLARAHTHAKNFRQARAAWQELLQMAPKSVHASTAWLGLADAHWTLGQWEKAARAYGRILKTRLLESTRAKAMLRLGLAHQKLGDLPLAAKTLRQVVHRFAWHPKRKKLQKQLQTWEAAGKIAPESWASRLDEIERLLRFRILEQAETLLWPTQAHGKQEEAPYDLPEDLSQEWHAAAGTLRFRQRDFVAAERFFHVAQIGADDKQRRRLLRWQARVFSDSGRLEEAVAQHLQIAAELPTAREGHEAAFFAAWLAANGGNSKRAVALFRAFLAERAARHPSRKADVHWHLGWNLRHLGMFSQALEHLQTAAKLAQPGAARSRALYWQARVLADLGKRQEAQEIWAALLQSESGSYYGFLAQHNLRSKALPMVAIPAHPAHACGDGVAEAVAQNLSIEPDFEPDFELKAGRPTVLPARSLMQLPLWSQLPARVQLLVDGGAYGLAAQIFRRDETLQAKWPWSMRAEFLSGLGDVRGAYRLAALRNIKDDFEAAWAYPRPYWQDVEAASLEHRLPPALLYGIMRQESGFAPEARSAVGAAGLMQLLPRTAEKIATKLGDVPWDAAKLLDPKRSIPWAAWYLGALADRFLGHPVLLAAGYNAGPKAVAGWLDRWAGLSFDAFVEWIPYRETRIYVRKVLANGWHYPLLYPEIEGVPVGLPQIPADNAAGGISF